MQKKENLYIPARSKIWKLYQTNRQFRLCKISLYILTKFKPITIAQQSTSVTHDIKHKEKCRKKNVHGICTSRIFPPISASGSSTLLYSQAHLRLKWSYGIYHLLKQWIKIRSSGGGDICIRQHQQTCPQHIHGFCQIHTRRSWFSWIMQRLCKLRKKSGVQ